MQFFRFEKLPLLLEVLHWRDREQNPLESPALLMDTGGVAGAGCLLEGSFWGMARLRTQFDYVKLIHGINLTSSYFQCCSHLLFL